MTLKESLEVFEIEEVRDGNFRILKQPSICFCTFKSSCGMYIKSLSYPDFTISDNYNHIIKIYLRGTMGSRDLRWFTVPAQYIQNFKQSIKEFCEAMNWKLVINNDRYIGDI